MDRQDEQPTVLSDLHACLHYRPLQLFLEKLDELLKLVLHHEDGAVDLVPGVMHISTRPGDFKPVEDDELARFTKEEAETISKLIVR